jgi:toxin CptA
MHAPPSVSYPVGRSAFAARACAGVGLLGLLAAGAWSLAAPFGWRQLAAFAAVLACGLVAALAWLRSPTGVLRWDGQGWGWEEGAAVAAGQPEITLDLQSRLLLRWRPEGGGARWLWAEQSSAPSHWDALRRAVYSRASTQVPAAGKPPAAEQ